MQLSYYIGMHYIIPTVNREAINDRWRAYYHIYYSSVGLSYNNYGIIVFACVRKRNPWYAVVMPKIIVGSALQRPELLL